MSTRAERRRNAKVVVAHAKDPEIDALAQAARNEEVLRGYCRSYKTRLEYFARSLQMVSRCLIKNDIAAAQKFIAAINKTTLKEARETMANREQALDIAIKSLQTPAVHQPSEALAQIKALVHDAFEGAAEATPEPVATASA